MTIAVNKREIALVERFKLTVEVVAEDAIEVEMPRLDERMTGLAIRDLREYPAESFEGGWRQRHEYRLDAFLCGEYTIPAMTAKVVDRRWDADAPTETAVTVNEFTVAVRSPVEGELDPTVFRDIRGPVSLPFDRPWTLWMGSSVTGVGVLTLMVIWGFRHRRRETPEVALSPHEWALGQLQALVDDRLVERGRVHEFYFRLSLTVRRYIEWRFDLTAPKQTTEEFMLETQGGQKLPVEYCGTVGSLLRACDMVKFAQHAPHAEEINKALHTARDFVDRSAESESQWTTAA